LVRVARALSPNSAGENGQELDKIWNHLVGISGSAFHAAPESILRWLLKLMNGSSSESETLRRYPLTWKILGRVFQLIPLFSLAKSLADRRFVAILQRTLKEASEPSKEAPPKPGKRKRPAPPGYNLDELKDPDGCVQSGQAIFEALELLLGRFNNVSLRSSHDRIGAEHLMSLFCSPATEAKATVAPLLSICGLFLKSANQESISGWESWLKTTSIVWSLHLQSIDDTLIVATDLFPPSAAILAKLKGQSFHDMETVLEAPKRRWIPDVQELMRRYLILPARTAFLSRQDTEPVVRALEVSGKTQVSGPALYLMAANTTELLSQGGISQGNDIWMKKVFQLIISDLRGPFDERLSTVKSIVRIARQLKMPLEVEDLRAACSTYAFLDETTEWGFIADVANCDPDVFHTGKAGEEFLQEICRRMAKEKKIGDHHEPLADTVAAIIKSFSSARRFGTFLQLWLEQMCVAEKESHESNSPWFNVGRKASFIPSLQLQIEKELTTHQLLGVLDWIQTRPEFPQAWSLWLSTLVQGVRTDEFKQAISPTLFTLARRIEGSPSAVYALRWRVFSKGVTWLPSDQRDAKWELLKAPLSKTLKKYALESAETFEAFKCCCQIAVAMIPDGKYLKEVEKLLERFTVRLSEAISSRPIDWNILTTSLKLDLDTEFRADSGLPQYLAWFICGSTRLNQLYFNVKMELPPPLKHILSLQDGPAPPLAAIWNSLLSNEHNINQAKLDVELIGRLTKALKSSQDENIWPSEGSLVWLQQACCIPLDAMTRLNRESFMSILMSGTQRETAAKMSWEGWKSVVSLATKLMSRPTFYDGIRFQHLVHIADLASDVAETAFLKSAELLELIERFESLASITIAQVTENNDERSYAYISDCESFVSGCTRHIDGKQSKAAAKPLYPTLLKSLLTIRQSQPKMESLLTKARQNLELCVGAALGDWLASKELLSSDDTSTNFRLLAAIDAAAECEVVYDQKRSRIQKLEKACLKAMKTGDTRAWKLQSILQKFLYKELENPRPKTFQSLESIPKDLREALQTEQVRAVISRDTPHDALQYLDELVDEYQCGCRTDGQLIAIRVVVDRLFGELLSL
jgi:nucleolar pre-ribosomal-associated protein 2